MSFVIDNFGGIVPKRSEHNLPVYGAVTAHNVKLRNGRIEAWREPCQYGTAVSNAKSFYILGCCLLSWTKEVRVAEVAPDWGRSYIVGRSSYPEIMTVSCECQPTYYRLGVPPPPDPPTARNDAVCSRTADARAYVYTYVNAWGEESAPSPASDLVIAEDYSVIAKSKAPGVIVSGLVWPSQSVVNTYNIVAINLYRATTGFREDNAKQQQFLSDYMLVAQLGPDDTPEYEDKIFTMSLGYALETHKVRMPPANLKNLTSLGGVVRLAGTVSNRVYLSENLQPWNWPVKYELTLDHNIVHMAAIDQRLYVTTDANAYVIDVSSCEDMKCAPVMMVPTPVPDISCGYANSFVATPHGLFYSSPLGVCLVDSKAQYSIITRGWFSEDDWRKLMPETARFAYWEGFLFVITDKVSFMLDINGDVYDDMKGSELTTISDSPIALMTGSNGTLFFMDNKAKVWTWDKGVEWRPFVWESRELTQGQSGGNMSAGIPAAGAPHGASWSPASVKIRTDGTMFTLVSPRQDPAYQRGITDEQPYRLPRVGRNVWYRVRLEGILPVQFVELGTAHFTINNGV